MKIYAASSWRNIRWVQQVVDLLRSVGHDVFDSTRPGDDAVLPGGFSWGDIDPDWRTWTPAEYKTALRHPLAQQGLAQDFQAMQWADACVAVMPFGRSASLELGWFIGRGKPAHVLLADGEAELMFGLAHLHVNEASLLATLCDAPIVGGR